MSILRDNLLVTAGVRAASMECEELITLPFGVNGERELAEFIAKKADKYINEDLDEPYDLYIEDALEREYGNNPYKN